MRLRILIFLLVAACLTAAQTPVKVRGKVVNLAPELHRVGYTIRLVSTEADFQTSLKPDQSFEFNKVPPGEYNAILGAQKPHSAFPGAAQSPVFRVMNDNISDVIIDMRDNPFPEFPGGGGGTNSGSITLRGVMTAPIVQIRRPATPLFFRMVVKDDVSGDVVPWAALLSSSLPPEALMTELKLSVGAAVTVAGTTFADGSYRISMPQSGSINGIVVPPVVPRQPGIVPKIN